MEYFKIDWDYDNLDIIGSNPQIIFSNGYNPNLKNSIWNVKMREFPNFSPNIEFELCKKAKPTNFLQRVGTHFGMFVDTDFKKIITNFNLPPHVFYPIKVYHKGKILEYYWLHYIINDFWEFIDKEKSKAVITDCLQNDKHVTEIDLSFNEDEILEISNNLTWNQQMNWKKIIFKQNFPKYDIYQTDTVEFVPVISETLKNTLQELNMDGFMVKPYDVITLD